MDAELKSRWNRMFAQAEEFEAVDKIEEARARVRQALREITEAQKRAASRDEKALERLRYRAERFVQRYDAAYEDWQLRVKQRSEQFLEREDHDYHAPLPVPRPDDHPNF